MFKNNPNFSTWKLIAWIVGTVGLPIVAVLVSNLKPAESWIKSAGSGWLSVLFVIVAIATLIVLRIEGVKSQLLTAVVASVATIATILNWQAIGSAFSEDNLSLTMILTTVVVLLAALGFVWIAQQRPKSDTPRRSA